MGGVNDPEAFPGGLRAQALSVTFALSPTVLTPYRSLGQSASYQLFAQSQLRINSISYVEICL